MLLQTSLIDLIPTGNAAALLDSSQPVSEALIVFFIEARKMFALFKGEYYDLLIIVPIK